MKKLIVGAIAGLALAGGVAYATVPDSGGVYTACKLNVTGTIRLIDPSVGNASLLGHCTSLETQISWNQQGQRGQQGLKGDKGDPGPAGAGVTSIESLNGLSCDNGGGQNRQQAQRSTGRNDDDPWNTGAADNIPF